MRSADTLARIAAPLLLAAGLAGCAAVGEPFEALRRAVAPAAGASAPAAAPQVTVAPATQAAFEAATRAQRAGRTAEAERGFGALARAHPELGGPHANLGLIRRQAGRLDAAAAEFEQAVRLSPAQPVYFNQLGITYRQLGQFEKARAAYEKAIALDPAYAAPILNLGILNDLYLNDAARALALYIRYLAIAPNGDAAVAKWVAELKNRKPAAVAAGRKEKA
jgi:tetratricopeptide (TPR) repeat protein